ncbi:hypothetical protein [Cyanobium sp. NIES-981]|uniref:hypothetical protein n=1 Tax=Cyanobium sp. NIES-981 TaxID=1851505 RepID=UPI0007DDC06C|nr:hypothetical protein [Cyanobium sp. NIES-981]SBO42484.1 conserved exported protein of unknown function [Cyanobium sp. NIES-981]
MRCQAFLLGCLVASLPLLASPAQARGFGGGGFRGGDFRGGGGYRFSGDGGDAWRGGYRGEHPLYGPGARPGVDVDRVNVNRVTINNNFYNRDLHGWNDAWRGGGYWNHRPWNHGWYGGWGGWGWWGPSAAAWGVAGLATGAAIGSLVNAAAEQQSTMILVPDTAIQLNYGSVESVGSAGVSFNYSLDGSAELMGAANCQQGLLNGQVPASVQQAQLLNAVCQVAYGSGS